MKPSSFILDGEIVIPVGKELSFDDLLQRIHPAESLVRKLAKEIPATLIVFDLLADEKGKPLVGETLALRRHKLETSAEKYFRGGSAVVLSPATTDAAAAKTWPSLVVEVRYDHFSQGRFRHGTKLLRWRPDKAPKQCTMDQVERKRNVSAFSLT